MKCNTNNLCKNTSPDVRRPPGQRSGTTNIFLTLPDSGTDKPYIPWGISPAIVFFRSELFSPRSQSFPPFLVLGKHYDRDFASPLFMCDTLRSDPQRAEKSRGLSFDAPYCRLVSSWQLSSVYTSTDTSGK